MKEKRNYIYDYMRVIACICIIGIHVTAGIPNEIPRQVSIIYMIKYCIHALFRIGLPIFTILSGTLILNNTREESIEYFYYKRFVKVVIPFFIISLFYSIWVKNNYHVWYLFTLSNWWRLIKLIPAAARDTLETRQSVHLWYVYYIIGIYLVAPFIKVMVQHMNEQYQKKFVILVIIMQGIYEFLPVFGMNFGVTYFIFSSGIVYFIMGYILVQEWMRKYDRWIIWLGIISYIVSAVVYVFFPQYSTAGIYDSSPLMIFQACAIFVFFIGKRVKICGSDIRNRIISNISMHTFTIYLVHEYVRAKVTGWAVWGKMPQIELCRFFCIIIFTFLLSYIVAMILDYVVFRNIENFMFKIIGANSFQRGRNIRSDKYKKTVITLSIILGCVLSVLVVMTEMPYEYEIVMTESSDSKDIIKLEPGVIVSQKFCIDKEQAIKLTDIETIFINITNESKGELLLKICDESGKVKCQEEYLIRDLKIGDYQKLSFNTPVKLKSDHEYTIQLEAKNCDVIPYMLLQDADVKNRYNISCSADGEVKDGTLLINYSYYCYFPDIQKVILILAIWLLIVYVLCSKEYINFRAKRRI